MAAAKTPIRMKGDTTCIHHKGRQLELYCEKCQELICTKCLSSVHKGHIICELSEIIPQKKQNIKNFIERTEKNDLVQIRKYITSTDTHFKDNDSTIEKLSHQLKMQTEKLKQDLDNLLAEKLSFYQKMKEDNDKLIQKYKQNMELFEEKLKQQMQDCKTVLQQGSYLQVYDTPCVINSPTSLPIKLILGTASFTPNTNPEGHLELAIGRITTSCQGQTSIDLDGSVSTSDRQEKLSSTQHGRKTDTKVMEEWESPCYVGSICPNTDDQAWTSYYYSDTLTLLDRKGAAIQKVTNEAVINNISLSHITHRLWVCDAKNNILELVSGKLTHRFRTQEEPRCICVTASNHVIVGLVQTHL
ncbi:uncharacterized protein LOC117315900 [Pecten maximus]|uniref:uncharacterized protein LOC117315900 n=1 Tax=Pecten maximus TaxID=6579 RepID=UPI001458D0D1|nr:uncharacterized protein LOC117315900 [Pecten maximus]